MPLVTPDDDDSGNGNGDNSGKKTVTAEPPDFLSDDADQNGGGKNQSDGGSATVVAEPPETAPKGSPNLEGGSKVAVGRKDMWQIARADPDEGERMLDEMEKKKEISSVRRENEKLRTRVDRLDRELKQARKHLRVLMSDSDVPLEGICHECTDGKLELKKPFMGGHRVQCDNCGDVKAGHDPNKQREGKQ